MTNADYIRSMTNEELEVFIEQLAFKRETPWADEFSQKFCRVCPHEEYVVPEYHFPLKLAECDFVDGECPHGSDILWWLNEEREEQT